MSLMLKRGGSASAGQASRSVREAAVANGRAIVESDGFIPVSPFGSVDGLLRRGLAGRDGIGVVARHARPRAGAQARDGTSVRSIAAAGRIATSGDGAASD